MGQERVVRLDRLGLFVYFNGSRYRPLPLGERSRGYTLRPGVSRDAGTVLAGQRVRVEMVPSTPVARLIQPDGEELYWEVRDASPVIAADPEVYRKAVEFLRPRQSVKDEFFSGPNTSEWRQAVVNFHPDLSYVARHATGACIMGALMVGAYEAGYSPQEINGIRLVGPATEMMETPRSANWWNNQRNVTKKQVLAALEHGAQRAEEALSAGG